jgi:sec-independent protein translocase protein TatB
MFDVSFSELMVIGVIALIVIGPERLPKVARTVGHLLGRAQRYVNDVKSDIRREIELDELRKFKTDMETAAQSVHTSLRDAESSLHEPAKALRQELEDTAREATGAVSAHPDANATPPAHADTTATPSATVVPLAVRDATTPGTPPDTPAAPVPSGPAPASPVPTTAQDAAPKSHSPTGTAT